MKRFPSLTGPRPILYLLLLLLSLALMAIWGAGVDVGPFLNLLSAAFGIFLAALVTSYIIDWVGRLGQQRQWNREWRIQNVEKIYGPLYNDIIHNIEAFRALKYYNGASANAWNALHKNYLFLAIPEALRKKLESYFSDVERSIEQKRELWGVMDRIAEQVHRQRFRAVGGNPSVGDLFRALTSHLMDPLFLGEEPPEREEGGWSPYAAEVSKTQQSGGRLNWRHLFREIRDKFRQSPEFREFYSMAQSLRTRSGRLQDEIARIIRSPSAVLGES